LDEQERGLAKIKNVIANFSASYHGYVDRYKRIPGEFASGPKADADCFDNSYY